MNSTVDARGVNSAFFDTLGAIQKWRHWARGRGSDKLVTRSDKGGRGVLTDGDITTRKNSVFYFAFIPFTSSF